MQKILLTHSECVGYARECEDYHRVTSAQVLIPRQSAGIDSLHTLRLPGPTGIGIWGLASAGGLDGKEEE